MAGIVEAFQKGTFTGQDHNEEYRALVICGSMSLFGGQTEAPPLTCFIAGYGGGSPPSFRGLMRNLLLKLGGDAHSVEGVMDRIIAIAESHGLPVSAYARKGSHNTLSGRTNGRLTGHMLQLFIKREHADSLAYASQPMGVPVQGYDSICHYAAKKPFASGQVRIYMDPEVFTDPSMTQTFHYCAHAPLVSEVVSPGLKTRGSMHQEMRVALEGFLGTQQAIHQTEQRIGFGSVRRPLVKVKFAKTAVHGGHSLGGYHGARFPGTGYRMGGAAGGSKKKKRRVVPDSSKSSSVWDVLGLGADGTDWDPFS